MQAEAEAQCKPSDVQQLETLERSSLCVCHHSRHAESRLGGELKQVDKSALS